MCGDSGSVESHEERELRQLMQTQMDHDTFVIRATGVVRQRDGGGTSRQVLVDWCRGRSSGSGVEGSRWWSSRQQLEETQPHCLGDRWDGVEGTVDRGRCNGQAAGDKGQGEGMFDI